MIKAGADDAIVQVRTALSPIEGLKLPALRRVWRGHYRQNSAKPD